MFSGTERQITGTFRHDGRPEEKKPKSCTVHGLLNVFKCAENYDYIYTRSWKLRLRWIRSNFIDQRPEESTGSERFSKRFVNLSERDTVVSVPSDTALRRLSWDVGCPDRNERAGRAPETTPSSRWPPSAEHAELSDPSSGGVAVDPADESEREKEDTFLLRVKGSV